MHLIGGTLPLALAPGQSIYYYLDSEFTANLTNEATVTGTPSNAQGAVIPNTTNVTDSSSASVGLQLRKRFMQVMMVGQVMQVRLKA